MAATLVDGIEVFDPRYLSHPTDVEPNDPDDDLAGEFITPVWPRGDWVGRAVYHRPSYDRRSDTLFMRFDDRLRPTVNVARRGGDVLVDLDTHEVIGLEVCPFLSGAVRRYPRLILILDDAELRGITHDEVQIEQIKLLPKRTVAGLALTGLLQDLTGAGRRTKHPKRSIVIDYYRNEFGGASA